MKWANWSAFMAESGRKRELCKARLRSRKLMEAINFSWRGGDSAHDIGLDISRATQAVV